ncbi:Agmatine deiminase [Parvibaculum lavamentivorans DS-1]|uniref:Putative agmatine deiminase n=1 Tax=Parvibaculum lavamentivorans (strain DS-1 / DSM 13023 / NCIMB 13966) TaxID=402881 RepID=A7HWX9_PARL1|nr:agmatine deiminase family protein [Parvibaculum lavamentivorans]ABS64412.1 Agmatine deiminase [Parvibaculum lavamentivorans DS-1]
MNETRTPADEGLFMPAEWEPHERCWMQWPCRTEVWGERLPQAYAAYAQVARAISSFEPVSMVCKPEDEAQVRLACGRNVETVALPIDDSWARDSGPIFVIDGKGHVAGTHWRFNAWGNAYHNYDADAAVGGVILERLGMRKYQGGMVFEGGSISVDGYGTLLTTEECLLNDNRNPGLTRQQIEEALALNLGVARIIWLDQGLEDDETSGHVDMVASFAGAGRVLLHMPEDKSDPNYARMQENRARLEAVRDARGQKLEVIEIPQPKRNLKREDGRRLCTSYVNAYIANGGVVMPTYEDPNDQKAAAVMAEAFPGRKIVSVPALEIARGGGSIHCITQQQPKGQALK